MKNFLLLIIFSAFIIHAPAAQTPAKRSIRLRHFGNDSIKISFNKEYFLIEDSCADIVRYGHMKLRQRMFFGPFKDISKDNNEIVAEGSYSDNGLKDGNFITHYTNGNLQAKGVYKENKLNGRWELFYPDGKPKLIFDAESNAIKILEAWDEQGKKIIENGNGNYSATIGNIVWSGKLNYGTPAGTWKAARLNDRTNTTVVKEVFKDGKFEKGNSIAGDYTDASRIQFISETDLPFINAEKMRSSVVPCDGLKRKQVVNAQYKYGPQAFTDKIRELVVPYLARVDLRYVNTDLELTGEISVKGKITGITYTNTFEEHIAFGLASELAKLPFMEPALVDGKPVPQKIVFTFKFSGGGYRYGYRLVRLNVNP